MKIFLQFLVLSFFVVLGIEAFAQQKLEGTIKSAIDNQPIVGAQINVKGKSTGTITNLDGKFAITLPPKAHLLIIKFGSYKPQEIDIAEKETVEVFLGDGTDLQTIVTGTSNASTHTQTSANTTSTSISANTSTTNNNSAIGITETATEQDNAPVLVCTSATAAVYHNHQCKGLLACKAEVKKATVWEAKKMGRRECRYCYPQAEGSQK